MKAKAGWGSFHLARRRGRDGNFYPRWRALLRFCGEEFWEDTGFALCDQCRTAETLDAECKCRAKANAFAQARLTVLTKARQEGATSFEALSLRGPRVRSVVTVGELLRVWDEHWPAAVRSAEAADRAARSFVRVAAFAFDMWKVKTAGEGPRGVRIGDSYPDEGRIGALALGDVLGHEAVRRYYAATVPDGRLTERRLEHVTVNSTLRQAREMFSKAARERIWEGRIDLPAGWERWKEFPLAAEPESEPEPLSGEQFAALVQAGEALRETEPDLWLLCRIARQTGLRCGSLREVRGDWVRQVHGRWWLGVRRNEDGAGLKSGVASYSVPLLAETAEMIAAHGPRLVFGEDAEGRAKLVNERHTAFMRAVVGDPRRGSQKAHRLRDTLAGALFGKLGLDAARLALGHASVKTTLDYYARNPFEASQLMLAEFGAFLPG